MRSVLLLSAIALTFCVAACTATSTDEEPSIDNAGAEQNLSTPRQVIRDIPIPPQSLPLSHSFHETLRRFGGGGVVTVNPTITPSGVFALTEANVHVQADYVANPPRINRLSISTRGTWSATARIDLDVTADGQWTASTPTFRKSLTTGTSLGGRAFEIAKVPLAVFPLPHAPNIQIQIELELAAACEVDFDAEMHGYAEIGVGGLVTGDVFYSKDAPKKVGFIANDGLTRADNFHITTPPHFAFKDGNRAQVHGRCGIQPSINATAAFVTLGALNPLADVGVKLIVEPYAQFDATFRAPSDWSAVTKSGVEGTVAPFGDFVGRPFQTTRDFDLKLFDFELGQGPTSSSSSP